MLPCTCSSAVLLRFATHSSGTRRMLQNSTWQIGQHKAHQRAQRSYRTCSNAPQQRQLLACAAGVQGVALPPQQQDSDSPTLTPAWDVVGLGQAMVDLSATVNDDFLVRLGVVKGSRR